MRLSTIEGDAGYDLYESLRYTNKISVIFNGTEVVGRCITADEEQGFVILYDEPIKIVDDELATSKHLGDVKIILTQNK